MVIGTTRNSTITNTNNAAVTVRLIPNARCTLRDKGQLANAIMVAASTGTRKP